MSNPAGRPEDVTEYWLVEQRHDQHAVCLVYPQCTPESQAEALLLADKVRSLLAGFEDDLGVDLDEWMASLRGWNSTR